MVESRASFLRKATSEGAAGPVRIESPRANELTPLDEEAIKERAKEKMARVREHKTGKGAFLKGNKLGGKKPKLAKLGIKLDPSSQAYENCLRNAESYRRHRVREYTENFGYVSMGVKSLLATASLQLAASRYMMDTAITIGDMDGLKRASSVANDARQNELAAWELCARESAAHKKRQEVEAPWMVRVATEQDAGTKKSHEALDGSLSSGESLGYNGGANKAALTKG